MATHQTLTNQALALAGLAQATMLVHQLATTGNAETAPLQASIGSLLAIDAENVPAIYGGLTGLRAGITRLEAQLAQAGRIAYPEEARYAALLIVLERQFSKRPDLQQKVRQGIERAQRQTEMFGLLHDNVLAGLGDLYHETISTLQPRVMVRGEPQYLSPPEAVNRIRALLLAGIRAALLWRQCGGSRWKFLFQRQRILQELRALRAFLNA